MTQSVSEMIAYNRKTIEILEGLTPTKPDEIAERDRQLAGARKTRDLLIEMSAYMVKG